MEKQASINSEPVTILQLTDTHFMAHADAKLRDIDTASSFREMLDCALQHHPNTRLVLLTGDLAEEPEVGSYQRLADILAEYDVNFACLPGNHDDYPNMLKVLNQEQFNCDKQRFIDDWQILMLDTHIPGSCEGTLSQQELEFLEQSLVQKPKQNTLICIHHHCIKTNSAWMDTMLIKNHHEFIRLVQKNQQVKAVIMGHIHQELDVTIGNLKLWGSPSTCFQFQRNSDKFALGERTPGYRWFELYPDGKVQTGVNYLAHAV